MTQQFFHSAIKAQKPYQLRKAERGRINPFFHELASFQPIPGVRYLWLLNEEGSITIGVEAWWKYPQLFPDASSLALPKVKLGHPSLVKRFDSDGRLSADLSAYIGGEVLLTTDGRLYLNNDSGRYGHISAPTVAGPRRLMAHAAAAFKQQLSIDVRRVDVEILHTETRSFYAYEQLWKNAQGDTMAAMRLLLSDYSGETGSDSSLLKTFTQLKASIFHPLRHHTEKARRWLAESEKYTDPQLLYDYISQEAREGGVKSWGSLDRRLQFIASQLLDAHPHEKEKEAVAATTQQP